MTPTDTDNAGTKLNETEKLSLWVSKTTLFDVPEVIRTRAKYLILDGLACGLLGAHLPWSEKAVRATWELEPDSGTATVYGWADNGKMTPQSAALLNSTFIQGFELDDWHSEAPLHSNSILLPALLAAAEHQSAKANSGNGGKSTPRRVSGSDLLLGMIVGYEVGPRVGLGLYGRHVLTTGWHSGAVFGPAASAAAVGRLLNLSAEQIEDAFGIACTQAGGLMSAQFGSEVKRMQHGFAARNGLLAAFLAKGGYVGIKRVFEQEYGGYLKQFSSGNGKTPQYLPEELTKGLGETWQTHGVRVKPYSAMAGTHPTIDCVRGLQAQYPDRMRNNIQDIKNIHIVMGEAAFHHGGWKAIRPLTSTGAQMSNAYVAATQMVHWEVMPSQFREEALENDVVWRLVDRTDCVMTTDSTSPDGRQKVVIEFEDGTLLEHQVDNARGVDPALSNEEIVQKWRLLTKDVIDEERVSKIEKMVLALEDLDDIQLLAGLMGGLTRNPIA